MQTPSKTGQKPPGHLRKRGKKLWRDVLSVFVLESHHLPLLRAAAEQLDRAEAARKEIERDGLIVNDRFGQRRAHPGIAVERSAQLAYLRIARELGLDVAPAESRGPTRPGTRA